MESMDLVLNSYHVGSETSPSKHLHTVPPTTSNTIEVLVPPAERQWEYKVYHEEDAVADIVEEYEDLGELQYLVRSWNGDETEVSLNHLLTLPNGRVALNAFNNRVSDAGSASSTSSSSEMVSTRPTRITRAKAPGFIDFTNVILSSEDELGTGRVLRRAKSRKAHKSSARLKRRYHSEPSTQDRQPRRRQAPRRVTQGHNYDDSMGLEESEDDFSSEAPSSLGKRKRGRRTKLVIHGPSAARRSNRSGRGLRSMHEIGEDDIPEVITAQGAAKAIGAKESFQPVASDDEFRLRHQNECDSCRIAGDDEGRGILSGATSAPFRDRKSTRQEQKDREDNEGEDPTAEVPRSLINNAGNVFFRCLSCFRAFHFHHLPSKDPDAMVEDLSDEELASKRFMTYCQYGDWTCQQCSTAPAKVGSLIAWRPVNLDTYMTGTTTEMVSDDAKEYLIRWDKCSYSKSTWMPGAWVWGVTKPSMRYAFGNRENGKNLPKMKFEDAVPEEWLRIDIVLDVEYTNVVKMQLEKVDLKRVKEVKRAYVKFKGLGYEDVVWDEPPDPQDTERWEDFRSAYDDWVRGRYVHLPHITSLNNRLAKERARDFEEKAALKEQPKSLAGGNLMAYQLDGVNWLYYQWHRQQNAILADEMGLGKTIQVIGFLLTLQENHGCWPFLVVVPNSTCANWRREIKHWAPSLRVVTYFGSSEARKLSQKYELFPAKGRDLKCHVVVTSYEAVQDDEFRKVFRGIPWQGLVVDEGQRLKNDKNILYNALSALNAPFKVLLTGTPLQNNARELFNLLQFLDASIDAARLEVEYTELSKENLPRLHDMLRPFFLRRTKAQVLTFLPAMAQIIVPVSLTVLQKKLYKSILARNPELLKAIFGGSRRAVAKTERASLSNILMQLRKCLCHPFVYNQEIEERSSNVTISHRNLVEASSKLQLLELMLPKLQERGHRVLIFSQFLNMLDIIEDFLDGLGLFHQRLDGSMGSLEKQKKIDEFNAPDSRLFAFLLSTRAGGVGINLATADTVIILDPDFNPHQDIQALSRAHRIGQKKKVLVFQLTTRSTAEEKIMQIGKKKMALDHALIEQMDADEDEPVDVESILRYGTEALFQDDDANDIKYDSASVDKLLDRSQIEKTDIAKDQSAESQFSFARVWANDKGILEDGLEEESDSAPMAADTSLWAKILKEREVEVAREAAQKAEMLGRGKRQRQAVDYATQGDQVLAPTPGESARDGDAEASDTDFDARVLESDEDEEDLRQENDDAQDLTKELSDAKARRSRREYGDPVFKRVSVAPPVPLPLNTLPEQKGFSGSNNSAISGAHCIACGAMHVQGSCPLKIAGTELCGLCGLAHYGAGFRKACPHLHSIEQCQLMLEAVKRSPEPREVREFVKKYLVGIIGNLRHDKKIAEERKRDSAPHQPSGSSQPPYGPPPRYEHQNFAANGG
ncbi:MAG: hypothetical protein Q9196_001031 [Gyalolechia fulgens]